VAHISLAFKNDRLIRKLRKRGEKMNKEEDTTEVDKEINEYVKRHKKALLEPTHAYITFESYLGGEVAGRYAELHVTGANPVWGQRLLGTDLKLRGAEEPGQMLWENRNQGRRSGGGARCGWGWRWGSCFASRSCCCCWCTSSR